MLQAQKSLGIEERCKCKRGEKQAQASGLERNEANGPPSFSFDSLFLGFFLDSTSNSTIMSTGIAR